MNELVTILIQLHFIWVMITQTMPIFFIRQDNIQDALQQTVFVFYENLEPNCINIRTQGLPFYTWNIKIKFLQGHSSICIKSEILFLKHQIDCNTFCIAKNRNQDRAYFFPLSSLSVTAVFYCSTLLSLVIFFLQRSSHLIRHNC